MKPLSRLVFSLFILIIPAIVLSTGCAKKSGVQLAEKTTGTMQDVNGDIEQASQQIDATQALLQKVINVGQSPYSQPAEVRKAYQEFSGNVGEMEKTASRLNRHIDEMNASGNEYFLAWSQAAGTYADPEIQELSQERRVNLRQSFTDIAATSAGMRGNLNSYLSQLKQIDTFLSNDLSAQGIEAIVPAAETAQTEGENLKRAFEPVQSSIQQARMRMMPGGAAAGGVSETADDQSGADEYSPPSANEPGTSSSPEATESMPKSEQ